MLEALDGSNMLGDAGAKHWRLRQAAKSFTLGLRRQYPAQGCACLPLLRTNDSLRSLDLSNPLGLKGAQALATACAHRAYAAFVHRHVGGCADALLAALQYNAIMPIYH